MIKRDLFVLVADKDTEHALKGLFTRTESLEIRSIQVDIIVEPTHDPGCAHHGIAFMSRFASRYDYGLLVFDHIGSGRELCPPRDLQNSINSDFSHSAWGDRARSIVLSPELEAWVWSSSPHVDDVIGWKNQSIQLREWLTDQGWLQEGRFKPSNPKEAFHAALYAARTPRSSSLYQQIAERVSLRQCADEAFLEFKEILQKWFPRD